MQFRVSHMSYEARPHRLSVFLVEDETLIQMMIAEMIEELGHTVTAQASDLTQALSLAQTADFDVAILDVNLSGQRIDPVAEALSQRNLPFIFASGYGKGGLTERFLRWSRFTGQFGGQAKMDSGLDYAASFSSFSCIA